MTRRVAHDRRERAGRLGLGGDRLVADRARGELDAVPCQHVGGDELARVPAAPGGATRPPSGPRRAPGRTRARRPRLCRRARAWRPVRRYTPPCDVPPGAGRARARLRKRRLPLVPLFALRSCQHPFASLPVSASRGPMSRRQRGGRHGEPLRPGPARTRRPATTRRSGGRAGSESARCCGQHGPGGLRTRDV